MNNELQKLVNKLVGHLRYPETITKDDELEWLSLLAFSPYKEQVKKVYYAIRNMIYSVGDLRSLSEIQRYSPIVALCAKYIRDYDVPRVASVETNAAQKDLFLDSVEMRVPLAKSLWPQLIKEVTKS